MLLNIKRIPEKLGHIKCYVNFHEDRGEYIVKANTMPLRVPCKTQALPQQPSVDTQELWGQHRDHRETPIQMAPVASCGF